MPSPYDAIVIGAGQSGLAAAYHLRQRGLRFLVLEAHSEVGGSWPAYYDSLTLFSPARYSSLPGLPFPGDPDRYPTRDEVVDYLREYARHYSLPVQTRSRAERVERSADGFRVYTSEGERFDTAAVIVATGTFSAPYVPTFDGQDTFCGRLLHAADYRDPDAFAGKRVIVVGAGNSAVQIGAELARVARVTLATRRPIRYSPQRILGLDLHFWLRWVGLDLLHRLPGGGEGTPVLDAGRYRAAIDAGRPDRRALFEAFTPLGVRWAGGAEEAVDVVIFATGYRAEAPFLEGLDVFTADGALDVQGGISRREPGLYFTGFPLQTNVRSATLRGSGPEAARIVRHLASRPQRAVFIAHLRAALASVHGGRCCSAALSA